MERAKRTLLWFRKLGWKWWVVIAIITILLIVFVAAPLYIYYSRDRDPQTYTHLPPIAEMVYKVTYDSGDGPVDQTQLVLKVTETGVIKNSEICFHAVTVFDTHPKRKVNAPIVSSTNIQAGEKEIWRSERDLRMVFKKLMEMGLPLVNTCITEITYSNYTNYPGWPYHINDNWTYEASYDVDVSFISRWTDTYQAEVVADDVPIEINGIEYPCFKVVHTLVETTNNTPSGEGVGATMTEYWYRDSKSIAPIKIEDSLSYKGVETSIMTGPPPSL